MAIGCFHPVVKVQSASIHFFLGEDEEEDSDNEEGEVCLLFLFCWFLTDLQLQDVDVKTLQHRREINKKTRRGEKKLQKKLSSARKVLH